MDKMETNSTSLPLDATSGTGYVTTTPSATTAQGGSFSTGSFIAGILTGLAIGAGLTHLVFGKGKRSNESGSACPMPHDEPTLVPPPSPAVDAHDSIHEVEVPTLAPAGVAKRKLTDEEVALIRAWEEEGVPAKEIAARLGISVKTVYSHRKKLKSNQQNQKNDGSQE